MQNNQLMRTGVFLGLLGSALDLFLCIIRHFVTSLVNPATGMIVFHGIEQKYIVLVICACLCVFFVALNLTQNDSRLKYAGIAGIVATAANFLLVLMWNFLSHNFPLFIKICIVAAPLGWCAFYYLLFKKWGALADDMKIALAAGGAGAVISLMNSAAIFGIVTGKVNMGAGILKLLQFPYSDLISTACTCCFFALLCWKQLKAGEEDLSKII